MYAGLAGSVHVTPESDCTLFPLSSQLHWLENNIHDKVQHMGKVGHPGMYGDGVWGTRLGWLAARGARPSSVLLGRG